MPSFCAGKTRNIYASVGHLTMLYQLQATITQHEHSDTTPVVCFCMPYLKKSQNAFHMKVEHLRYKIKIKILNMCTNFLMHRKKSVCKIE
jgi:hypothetical protein